MLPVKHQNLLKNKTIRKACQHLMFQNRIDNVALSTKGTNSVTISRANQYKTEKRITTRKKRNMFIIKVKFENRSGNIQDQGGSFQKNLILKKKVPTLIPMFPMKMLKIKNSIQRSTINSNTNFEL